MNAPTELVRTRVPKMPPLEEEKAMNERQRLKQEAMTILGYRIYDGQAGPTRAFETHSVLRVLNDLEIHPFTKKWVDDFMKEKARLANEELERQKRVIIDKESAVRRRWNMLATFFGLCSVLSVVLFVFANVDGSLLRGQTFMTTIITFFATLVCRAFSNNTILRPFSTDVLLARHFSWEVHSLAVYQPHVPDSVIDLAVGVKKRLPAAEFYVHQLAEDPFLELRVLDHSFFIAHWDEPGFFSQRTV